MDGIDNNDWRDDVKHIDGGFLEHAGKDSFENDVWIFDTLRSDMLKRFPMRLDMPLFALCTHGNATLHINVDHYRITPDCLIALMPNSSLNGISASADVHALFLGVSLNFAKEVLPDIHALLPVVFGTRENPVVELSDADSQCLQQFHAFLWHIIRSERGCYKRQMVQNLVRAMLYKLIEIYDTSDRMVSKRSRNEDIFFRFVQCVESDYKVSRSVQYYAEQLCITPKHLTTVVKAVSKLTAGDWITNYVVLSAKVLLRSSDKSIQEVALELNFPNQSFFGKYFKKHTGMSPQAYRKQYDR